MVKIDFDDFDVDWKDHFWLNHFQRKYWAINSSFITPNRMHSIHFNEINQMKRPRVRRTASFFKVVYRILNRFDQLKWDVLYFFSVLNLKILLWQVGVNYLSVRCSRLSPYNVKMWKINNFQYGDFKTKIDLKIN